MIAEGPARFEIRDKIDHLEVTGLKVHEMQEALRLYAAVQDERLTARDALYATMLGAGMPLISEATQRQVQRTRALRDELLRDGYETYRTLAHRRDCSESSARAWVARLRHTGKLFTVRHQHRTLIPSIQLTRDGQLDQEITILVRPLLSAGKSEWALWAWLIKPAGLLSGDIPAEVVRRDPQRAELAAQRCAAAHGPPPF